MNLTEEDRLQLLSSLRLLNSMSNRGESHTEKSIKKVNDSFDILNKPDLLSKLKNLQQYAVYMEDNWGDGNFKLREEADQYAEYVKTEDLEEIIAYYENK